MTGTAGTALAAMRRLPVRPLSHLLRAGPPLVLAPHPDDESLGCGGMIAACCDAGTPPVVVVVTDGAGSHPRSAAYPPDRLRAVRAQEAQEAVEALGLGAERLHFLGLPDTASPMGGPVFEAAVAAIEKLGRAGGCGSVVSTWEEDPHCDHVSAHLLGRRAAAGLGVSPLSYPVWGWTLRPEAPVRDPAPRGFRLDVSAQMGAKRRAIAAHRSQYAGLITDDPEGFQLPPGFVALFEGSYETFLET